MKRISVLVLGIMIFLASGTLVPLDFNSNPTILDSGTPEDNSSFNLLDSSHSLSQDELEGTLNSIIIEQTGNKTTSTIHAETDSNINVETNLIIDTANDWVGSKASVNLWNLNRLYVENGSVSAGIEGSTENPAGSVLFYPYGWDAFSGTPDVNMDMIAEYSNQELTVIANGYGTPGNYLYANESYVYWSQTVNNTPYSENFIFNFDYFYNRGPVANSDVVLRAYVDDILIWTNTTVTILDFMWYNSGNILVDLTGIGSQFEFKIGLYFTGDVIHTQQFIEFTLDNINLVAESSPTFNEANIKLNIGGESVAITGTSTAYAYINNSSLWTTENVLIEFTTDQSYSFDYIATMLSSRYVNSTRTTTQLDDGVHYTSLPNENPRMTFYTFIGAIPDIDDFTLVIRVPEDWANVTVLNPSGTSVTSSCIIHPGTITIPNNLILDNLGWWEVRLESPNYLRTIQTVKLNEPDLTWIPDTVYKTTNKTKLIIEIGGSLPIPTAPQDVGISWLMPNETEWFSESISGGSLGAINSSQLEFGSLNATTGIWQVEVVWTNGTQVAFGYVNFEVHHRTSLISHESVIDAESGLSISNFVYFQDIENGMFLMDPATTVTANWSMTVVNFLPDPIQNRWVGTFDTSLVEPGIHQVVVNASRPFFDDASCTFLVTISLRDNDLTIDNPADPKFGIGDTYLATFSYRDTYGVGISGANVSVDFTGPTDGVTWSGFTDIGGGDYSIEFTAVHSGSYAITISASKDHYEESEDALFISVGPRSTNLSLENGTSAIISFGEEYRLVVYYTNGTGYGLDGASVGVSTVTPETGLSYTTATNEGNGYFSFILTPDNTGTYTLWINASQSDYTPKFEPFILTATTIAAQLRVDRGLTSASVGVSHPFEILVFYEQTGGISTNLSLATLQVNFTSFITLDYSVIPQAEGYLIQFDTEQMGRYEFTITASIPGFQNGAVQFALFVQERAIQVVMEPLDLIQLSGLNINLQLIEIGLGSPVSGANVSYKLYRLLGVVMEGYLAESETSSGNYSVFIQPQWYNDEGYTIRIFIEKENYILHPDYDTVYSVRQSTPPDIVLLIFFETVTPPFIGILAVSIVSLSGRAVYRRKKKAQHTIDLANKIRFSDAQNILGIIVLHKNSGLPIYSKMLKGGFEEGMLSGFITAIMHFRSEFATVDEDTDDYRILPISDIILAIPTSSFICAFITLTSASTEQEEKMIGYARAVGMTLEDTLSERPTNVVDVKTAKTFEWFFDDFMDGGLIRKYQIGEKALSRQYKRLGEIIPEITSNGIFKLNKMIRALEVSGLSETEAYRLTMDAVDKEIILPIYSYNGDEETEDEES